MNKLKELRAKSGLKQTEVSEQSGINLSTLQKLELDVNDVRIARVDTVYKLAKFYGVTMEEIIGEDKL